MIPGYALEQLRRATSILACGTDRLQKRLAAAYGELEPLIEGDFPQQLGKDFEKIISRFHAWGSIGETTAAMSDFEANQVAGSILNLCFAVEAAECGRASANRAA